MPKVLIVGLFSFYIGLIVELIVGDLGIFGFGITAQTNQKTKLNVLNVQ
jgi:hypothetical protein